MVDLYIVDTMADAKPQTTRRILLSTDLCALALEYAARYGARSSRGAIEFLIRKAIRQIQREDDETDQASPDHGDQSAPPED